MQILSRRTPMASAMLLVGICLAAWMATTAHVRAADPLSLDNVSAPAANTADEPLATAFSAEAAARFLDAAALDWTRTRKCFTCHTNYAYLMARRAIGDGGEAERQIRGALEELVEQRWEKQGPRWDAEVVMSAAVLALHDAATTGKLHPTTRKALDRMWTVQREDGGFRWLQCGWPPMESDDHFGATMALIGVGAAPEDYAKTDAAQRGITKLREYLAANPPPTLHHQAMVLWASTYVDGLLTDEHQRATIDALFQLQKDDGGWALATLGDWQRADGKEQDTTQSDGYATGFCVYVLRRSGVEADDARLKKAVAWLKSHQRESGRWFTRSLNKDSKHYISHAGTAFAVLALGACDATK